MFMIWAGLHITYICLFLIYMQLVFIYILTNKALHLLLISLYFTMLQNVLLACYSSQEVHQVIISDSNSIHLIYNISGVNLSKYHIRALSKGLNFIPTPKPITTRVVRAAFRECHRRLYLKYYRSFLQESFTQY